MASLQDRAAKRGFAGPGAGEHNEHTMDGFSEGSVFGRQRLNHNKLGVDGGGLGIYGSGYVPFKQNMAIS